MQMNWEQKIKDLERQTVAIVRLVADGYNLSIQPWLHRRRIVLQWFVDGTWKGEYSLTDSEIGSKFGYPKYIRPTKKEVEVAKIFHRLNGSGGKRFDVKAYIASRTTLYAYYPFHPSATSLIRTLKKNCKEIILVE